MSAEAEAWVDYFLASDRERRLKLATWALESGEAARLCWMGDHSRTIERLHAQLGPVRDAVSSVLDTPGFSASGSAAVVGFAERINRAIGAA